VGFLPDGANVSESTVTAADSSPPGSNLPTDASPPVDGSGTVRARCVLAPNPGR